MRLKDQDVHRDKEVPRFRLSLRSGLHVFGANHSRQLPTDFLHKKKPEQAA